MEVSPVYLCMWVSSADGRRCRTDKSPTDFILGDAEVITSKNHTGCSFSKCLVSFCGGILSLLGDLIYLNFMNSLPLLLPRKLLFQPVLSGNLGFSEGYLRD